MELYGRRDVMRGSRGISTAWPRATLPCAGGALCALLLVGSAALAKPVARPPQELTTYDPGDADVVGGGDGVAPVLGKAAANDTIWIADWSFDAAGGACTSAGWFQYDNRILNDGSNYWSVSS